MIILIILLFTLLPQKAPAPTPEIVLLQREFIQATEDYKASLAKLVQLYESDIPRAESRLDVARKEVADGLMARSQMEERETELAGARAKVEDTRKLIAQADEQIKNLPSKTELVEQYKRDLKQRRRAMKPKCPNWHLTAYQRTTGNSVSFGYRFVCQN